MKKIKQLLGLAVIVALVLTVYLCAPLILTKYTARSRAIEALRWVDDSLRGSALERQVRKQLEQAGVAGTITALEVTNDHGTAKLDYTYGYEIRLGPKLLFTVPIEVKVTKKMMHRADSSSRR